MVRAVLLHLFLLFLFFAFAGATVRAQDTAAPNDAQAVTDDGTLLEHSMALVFGPPHVINDRVGFNNVVLIGDTETRSVRACRRDARVFDAGTAQDKLRSGDATWLVAGEALVGPDNETLPRMPGHFAYWFAWSGYMGAEADFYGTRQ